VVSRKQRAAAASRKGWRNRYRAKAQAAKGTYRAERKSMIKARAGVGAGVVGAGAAVQGEKSRRERQWRSRYRAMQASQDRAAILDVRPDAIRISESIRLRAHPNQ
jgi:hypothetical protein